MLTPSYELHRSLVIYSDPLTGRVDVQIPDLLGSNASINMPTKGLVKRTDGYWNVPSIGSTPLIAISTDRTKFLWLGALAEDRDPPALTNEPIGHEDRTKSIMSFSNATRTFTIEPSDESFAVWCKGWRYVKAAPESVTIPNTTGLYYISFNSLGELQYTTTFFVWDQETPTSYIYWNAATSKAEFFADERHGITMDWQTHEYLHRTRGAAIASGFDASNFDVTTQNGNTNAQAQLDIANGTFFDEDLQVDVVHSATPTANTWEQDLQGPARIPVFYRSGTGWVMDSPTDYPVKKVTARPGYNSASAGSWSVTQLGSNSYGIQWIVATNQLSYPVLSIMGQAEYNNVGQAEAVTWQSMDMTGLPIFEIRILYKIIFRATGSNTPGCYFVEIDDYRTAVANATSTAAAVVDHGNLTGLSDDDHTQYLLASGTRSATTLTVTGNLTVDTDTLFVDAANNRVGLGTTSPQSRFHMESSTGEGVRMGSVTDVALIGTTADDDELRISGGIPDQLTVGGNIYLAGNSHATYPAAVRLMSNGTTRVTVDGSGTAVTGTLDVSSNTTVGGNLTVDTDTFYVGATANQVGVGTVLPSAKLDVVGDTELNGSLSVVGSTGSTISLRSDSIATALSQGGVTMGIVGGATIYYEAIGANNSVAYSSDGGVTGGTEPVNVSYNVDARRAGAIAIVTGTVDFQVTTAGYGTLAFELRVNGNREPDQGIVSETALGGANGRLTVSKTWIVALPTDSTTLLNLKFWKTLNAGAVNANATHTALSAVVFG